MVMFQRVLQGFGLPVPVREHRFEPSRKWRFDYAWPEHKVALEVEGGVWKNGRHNRAKGFLNDMEKYNAASALGWTILRTTPKELLKMKTIDLVKSTIQKKL